MGCASNDDIEEDLKHAAPDFDVAADPDRTSYCKADFRYRFVPGEFAQLFFKNYRLREVPVTKPENEKKKAKQDSDDESSEENLRERAYEPVRIPYVYFYDDMLVAYDYLSKADVCAVYNYLNFRPGWVLKRVHELSDVTLQVTEYLRFAYVFYHYNEVLHLPALALFYYADEQFNRRASLRYLRTFLRQHYAATPEEARAALPYLNAKSAHLSAEQFCELMIAFKRKDPVAAMFRVREVKVFDVSIRSLNSEEREFSDISTRNRLNSKIDGIRRKAIEEGWDQETLEKRIKDAESDEQNQSIGNAAFDNTAGPAVSGYGGAHAEPENIDK